MRRSVVIVLGLALVAAAPFARAQTYRMDLIVFLDKSGSGGEQGRRPEMPELRGVIDPSNVAALKAAGIELLPPEQSALNEHWQRLRNSKNYQPLLKLAWTQKNPPAERGPALRVKFGQGQGVSAEDGMGAATISPVEGSVALLLGHYLQLDARLQYTLPTGSGSFAAYRLDERRRMRRDELHHLDSARLGVLAIASKLK